MSEFGTNLLQNIAEDFNKRIRNDKKLKQIANRVRDGTNYEDANEFAIRCGELLSEAFTGQTDGLAFISKEVGQEAIAPMLEYLHELVAETTTTVQTNMNAANDLGIGVATPALDTNRIEGIVEKLASYDTLEQGKWMLKEPVVNYSQAIVDRSIRDNAERAGKMGLKAYIVRKTEPHAVKTTTKTVRSKKGKVYRYPYKYSEPCPWCISLAGTYEYIGNGSNIPRDVYRRHEACRCTLTFVNGKQRQNVWNHSEAWTEEDAQAQIQTVENATQALNGDYYPAAVAGVPQGKPMSFEEADTGNVNPNFDKAHGYQINCQSCVVTMEARLRGYDVEVLPNTKGSMLQTLSRDTKLAWKNMDGTPAIYEIGNDLERQAQVANRSFYNAKTFEKRLKESLQPDARYNFSFTWKGGRVGNLSGHIVDMDISNDGILHIYDPQSNRHFYDKEVSDYLKRIRYKLTYYGDEYSLCPQVMRVDDKLFNLDVVDKIMKPK